MALCVWNLCYFNVLLPLKKTASIFHRWLELFHWFSKTNVPRQLAPGGYRLKWYIVLQFGCHQFLFGPGYSLPETFMLIYDGSCLFGLGL